jgi:transcriptional repressor NrdR
VSIRVIKKDGNRVPFERAKIKAGLEKACWKRPISDEQIEAAVSAVEREIYDRFENEVETRDIGELVMKELGKLDQVAYVRFASVYREFKDARDFVEELEPILNESKRSPR